MKTAFGTLSILSALILNMGSAWSAPHYTLNDLTTADQQFHAAPNFAAPNPQDTESLGDNLGLGNMVGVSANFIAADYEAPSHFYAKVGSYFAHLKQANYLRPSFFGRKTDTVVGFSELIGMYLVALGSPNLDQTKPIAGLPQYQSAILKLSLKHFFNSSLFSSLLSRDETTLKGLEGINKQTLRKLFSRLNLATIFPTSGNFSAEELASLSTHFLGLMKAAKGDLNTDAVMDKVSTFLFRNLINAQAEDMAFVFDQTFSQMAKTYGVFIDSGSIPLPNPTVDANGRLQVAPAEDAKIANVALIYAPSGKIIRMVRKHYIPAGEFFTNPYPVEDIHPVATGTSLGTIGTIICADSWYEQSYVQENGAKILMVPEYADETNAMAGKWKGYVLATNPTHHLTADEVYKLAGITDSAKYEADTAQNGDSSKQLTELQALEQYTSPYWGPKMGIPYTMVIPNRTQFLDKGSDNGFEVTWENLLGLPQHLFRPAAPAATPATVMNVYLER